MKKGRCNIMLENGERCPNETPFRHSRCHEHRRWNLGFTLTNNQKVILWYLCHPQQKLEREFSPTPLSPKKHQNNLNKLIEKKMAYRCELGITHPTEWGRSVMAHIRTIW